MSERHDKDLERTVHDALERLAHGWDPVSIPPGQAAGEGDARSDAEVLAHLEALSLLAYAVEPEAPPAGHKAEVLHAARAEPKAPPRSLAVAPASPAGPASSDPVDVTLRQIPVGHDGDPGDLTLVGLGSSAAASGPALDVGDIHDVRDLRVETDRPEPRQTTEPPPAANSNVPLYLLAAGLVFCLVGLGYLYGQLQTQSAQNLARQAELEAQVDAARSVADSMRARVQMVTDVARLAYPMQPVAGRSGGVRTVARPAPGEARPDGIVFVCGQHERWYLSLSGFEPPPAGKTYHLWFKTRDGAVDAGPVDLTDGRADVGDLTMPDGTEGFLVSLEEDRLEDGAEVGDEPLGQIILQGDQPVKL